MIAAQQLGPLPSATKTGKIPFRVRNTDIKTETWYAIYGCLSPDVTPLICLHGGPGMAHNYILPCAHLSSPPYSRPVILYDQIGCGNSTHLRHKKGDADFWTPDLFIAELENLTSHLQITKFDLLGQSWGGMLAALYATRRPVGLNRLIICNSPASLDTWVEVADQLRSELPPHVQATLKHCEEQNRTDSPEYEEAMMVFYERHVCRVVPFPDELVQTLQQVKDDDTVYLTMNGPSEFHITGTLRHFDLTPLLHKISVPSTLLINGTHDEAQDITMEPFYRLIPGEVKWVRFEESSHCPHLEETEKFVRIVGEFLK